MLRTWSGNHGYAVGIRAIARNAGSQASLHVASATRPRGAIWTIKTPACLVQKRCLSNELISGILSHVPGVLLPPVIFVGLGLVLWTLKCVNMVIFQNKIIYMPSLPPNARREEIADNQPGCASSRWREQYMRSTDGTRLALCIGETKVVSNPGNAHRPIVLLYFQGNGSSSPPRMPMLSRVMTGVAREICKDVTLVALSYRGYWKSQGRASQRGIEKDARAFLDWAMLAYPDHRFVVWGQSIGAGVAAVAVADALGGNPAAGERIDGIILETPFVSVRRMLVALYPQKWLPYRHLWPFLRNWWDSEAALKSIAASGMAPPILLVIAGEDEIIPADQARFLTRLCEDHKMTCQTTVVAGSYHNDATLRSPGRVAIASFIARL